MYIYDGGQNTIYISKHTHTHTIIAYDMKVGPAHKYMMDICIMCLYEKDERMERERIMPNGWLLSSSRKQLYIYIYIYRERERGEKRFRRIYLYVLIL